MVRCAVVEIDAINNFNADAIFTEYEVLKKLCCHPWFIFTYLQAWPPKVLKAVK